MAAIELFAWSSAYGFPSFDPFCLTIEAYLEIAGLKWMLNEASSPMISPSGELPVLKIGNDIVVGTTAIIKALKARGHDLDNTLTVKEQLESQAFIALIEEKLHEALLYSWYLEEENYGKSTRVVVSRSLSLLSKYTIPNYIKTRVRSRLSKIRTKVINGKQTSEIYEIAKECYQALADKLGNNDFFYGSSPTTLDVVAFGHLAIHSCTQLQNPKLFSILSFEFPTLIKFCDRMNSIAFKNEIVKSPFQRPTLRQIINNFVRHPDSYLSWAFEGFEEKVVTERMKEERIERFWRGFSVFGAVVFFGTFFIRNIKNE